ncbi:hypothetical protein [Bartonella sp. HY406]|uniref:hypothetical protein n=1 Tax=Bartonella sp. HY406 TaxID=2979331 RepID=UPI0021C56B92|nr:hypothetical protein [Bartonella sp. HY406]UXN05015.1 hypothetical protein N6B01_14165 [Bartonella sp. HY406]
MKLLYYCFRQAILLLTVSFMVGQTNAADFPLSPESKCYEQRVFEQEELRKRYEICFEPDVLMFCDSLYGPLIDNRRLLDLGCSELGAWHIKNNILYFEVREYDFSSQCEIKIENDGITLSGCPDFDRFPGKWQPSPQD